MEWLSVWKYKNYKSVDGGIGNVPQRDYTKNVEAVEVSNRLPTSRLGNV